jgi:hypothetical protein
MDEQTEELADVIEGALVEVGGDSRLYRVMAEHAARAAQMWIDYLLQRGELRMIDTGTLLNPGTMIGTVAADVATTVPIEVVQ